MPLLPVLIVILMIASLVDIITRDQSLMKHLPKPMWAIIVIMLPVIGSALWFTIGRVYPERPSRPAPILRIRPRQQTQRAPLPSTPMDLRTTEQQIEDLDREIEEWRLREEIAKRKQERGDA